MIAVGLVPQFYKLDHQPGWLPNSVAFHADDGKYVTIIFFTVTFMIWICSTLKHFQQCVLMCQS